jgi:hypothetical protein
VKGGLLGSICLDRTPPPAPPSLPSRPASLRLPAFGASVFQYFPNQANNRSQGTGWKIAVSDRQQQQPLASTQGSEIENFIRKFTFRFYKKATKICAIFLMVWDICLVSIQTMRKIVQIFEAFSEKLNFTIIISE